MVEIHVYIYIIYKYIQYKSVMAAIACSKYNPPRSVLGQLPGLAPIGSVFLGGGASSKEVLKTSGCFFTRPKKKTWNTCIHYFLGGEEDTANPPFGQLILVSFWTKTLPEPAVGTCHPTQALLRMLVNGEPALCWVQVLLALWQVEHPVTHSLCAWNVLVTIYIYSLFASEC